MNKIKFIKIDRKLHRLFKMATYKRGVTMKGVAEDLIAKKLKAWGLMK